MGEWLKAAGPALGGVVAAAGSALCCAGPLVAVTVGMSGAGIAATFEPWRPWFLGGSVLSLGLGFFLLDREERRACEPDRVCADAGLRRSMRVTLWVATGIAAVLATFPAWQGLLL